MRSSKQKILTREAMHAERARLARERKTLVFTNGCFDLLHAGHVDYLEFARAQGDALVLGLNSDRSVRGNKGPSRPVIPEAARARVVAALECVDYVVLFDEAEPADLIRHIEPDVLVKGEDWAHFISGRDTVEARGGRVVLAPLVKGWSTTRIIERLREPPGPPRDLVHPEAEEASHHGP